MVLQAVEVDFGGAGEVRFERMGKAGVITLTRPKALNALNLGMVRAMTAALDEWERDEEVSLVVIKGEGRAFSAGGDLMAIHGGKDNPDASFFADEYRLNTRIQSYGKPYVALIDGIVMGGGVGISFHGSHPVVTENAQFAMPEVGIGFFPDVGGSHLLPSLAGSFGTYLALTGARIRWGDVLGAGLAKFAVKAENIDALLQALAAGGDADAALGSVVASPEFETPEATREKIARWFGQSGVREIFAVLERESEDEDAARLLAAMRSKSPTSLLVTFRQIVEGRGRSMADCMKMEYRLVSRMLHGHDFYEGIRAAIIDKGDVPVWRPADISGVSQADVDAYFAPLADGDLTL